MWVFSIYGGDLLANPELRRFARSAAAVVLFPASEAHHFGWRYGQMVAGSNTASPKTGKMAGENGE
jgi:esterase/lipase superfamily enzyme